MTGWDVTGEELLETAKRIVLAKRMYNLREGWTRADDTLPPRLLTESLEMTSGRSATLTRATLERMIDAYYELRGLDPAGMPSEAALADLRLQEPLATA